MPSLIERKTGDRHSVAIETTDPKHLATSRRGLDAMQKRWLDANNFDAAPGTVAIIPDAKGGIARVLVGVDRNDTLGAIGGLPYRLPVGRYHLADDGALADNAQAALGWAMGAYWFQRYRKAPRAPAELAIDAAT
ncbi:MAG TPA: leucyl aminopeptidase family protein, partial [Luteibacter sp.]|nr:leucyl aminopeptidase family protein [Luteibacter sp.]